MIGAQQALASLDNHTYIAYWQSLDRLMHVRMPFASNLVLIVFIVNLIALKSYRRCFPYLLLIISFLCLVAKTIVTVKLQLPVNAMVQSLDLNYLPADVSQLKSATMVHFIVRAALRFSIYIFDSSNFSVTQSLAKVSVSTKLIEFGSLRVSGICNM